MSPGSLDLFSRGFTTCARALEAFKARPLRLSVGRSASAMLPDLTWVLGALLVLVGLWSWRQTVRKRLPPGPAGLPIVGYLPFLTGRPHEKLLKLKKQYGPIYTVQFGSHQVVILAGYQVIKEAFLKDAFFGRPKQSILKLNKETERLDAFTGFPWKEQRRLSIQILKDLGLSKSVMETNMEEEIKELLERIEQEKGHPITIIEFLSPSMSNNIASMVFGKRKRFDDPKRIEMDKLLNIFSSASEGLAWFTFFPFLKPLIELLPSGNHKKLDKAFGDMKRIIREEIEEHKKVFDPNNVRDFIDRYLIEVEKKKHDHTTTFKDQVLEDVVFLFFGGGSETVRNSVDWLLQISAVYPEVQTRVQAEVSDVVGGERIPCWSDHTKMPFTEAVVMEMLRWRTILPINLPRYTLEDVELHSYKIPKHTQVFAVLWAVHHDPDLWGEDADSFRPDRFLSEDGKEVRKPEYYMPFSVGKRVCPGESMAYMEMFMYFTAILQKFNVKLANGEKPDLDYMSGMVIRTKPHKLQFELRS